ncbi:Zn-dependent hydrolase [Agrilactobacillus fermenti]|uniref:Zn-dependent hydrolase n=1 Tax=Agrilactobacillus fermenti TaxID=2586909 RepID=UPI001E4EE3BB|nr:Zn-dependent hydrolase [Agrilactobacillus fermenti]MCD2256377.1 Zn-dependent hydrolase [Agrilactobacillus fermenti]
MAEINALSGEQSGQNRLVYSSTWIQAQQQLIAWGQQLGLRVTVDRYGTVYLDLVGREFPGQIIATGSHMDTVRQGGDYDGLYGVIGGLEAIANLAKRFGQPKKTLRLIAFSEEEGSRFPATFTGSKHYARLPVTETINDDQGLSFAVARAQAVAQLVKDGVVFELPQLPETFTELHIEQGPRLFDQKIDIGLVESIVGQKRYTVVVKGQANHAGTTPMVDRADALQTAVMLIHYLQEQRRRFSEQLTLTVGAFAVLPNTANVIPGRVQFTVDCRSSDAIELTSYGRLVENLAQVETNPRISIEISQWTETAVTELDSMLLTEHQKLADKLGFSWCKLASGAGHDSQIMAQVARTTMIFVPSVGGISHAPAEYTPTADLERGLALLTASLYEQAYGGVTTNK